MDAYSVPTHRYRRPTGGALVVAVESVLLVALFGAIVGLGRSAGGGTVDPPPPPSGSPVVTPTPTPTPTPSPAPSRVPHPPTCFYGDLPTERDAYADWAITLLDTIYRLPSTYQPSDLVDSVRAGLNGGYLVRALVLEDLAAMAAAARAAGAPFEVVSAFRSFATQQATFSRWVRVGGYDEALRTSARAGHSEHQLGTSIDVSTPGGPRPWEYRDWATTTAGAWMAEHAWEFGFVMSYPRDSFARTCYDYEPWHYRYIGRELAAAIRASGLTPREYLLRLQ
jgi:D-alanyl-D-alanine carboxypeptidase